MYYTVFFFLSSPFFLSLSQLSIPVITRLYNTLLSLSLLSFEKKYICPALIPLLSSYSSRPSLSLPVSLSLDTSRTKRPKSSNRTNVKSGVSALSSTSTAFGTAASNQRLEQTGNGHIDEALRQQALAEEEAVLNQYKVTGSSFSFSSLVLLFFYTISV